MKFGSAWLFFLLSGSHFAAAQEPPGVEGVPGVQEVQPAPEEAWIPVRGSLSTRFRVRWAGGDSDQDLYETLTADLGDPEVHFATAHFMLRVTEDLDGNVGRKGAYVFDSIDDSFSRNANGRLYYGYLDFHADPAVPVLRLGRQWMDETPVSFYFDGLRAETAECKALQDLQLGAYGGIPVHPFESSSHGDTLAGAFVKARLWPDARLRIDYTRVRDAYLADTHRNDLLGFGVRQNLGRNLQVRYQHNLLDGHNRDVLAQVLAYDPEHDVQVQASYTRLLKTQRMLATDLDAFFLQAEEYVPYHQARLFGTKGFGEHFNVQAGADARLLEDDDEEGPRNREFRRYFVSPTFSGWPDAAASLTLTYEFWDTNGSDRGDLSSGGADLSYRWSKDLKASIGTMYSLYKYDYFSDSEREDVRTYYFKLTCGLGGGLKGTLSYEYEDADLDEYQTLKVGMTYSF